eukprot:1881173-Rhodomonas_salina.2
MESCGEQSSDVVSELDDSVNSDACAGCRCRGTPSLAPTGRPCLICVVDKCSSAVHDCSVRSRRVRRLQISRIVRSETRYRIASSFDVIALLRWLFVQKVWDGLDWK